MFEKVTIVIGATDESSSLVKIVESIADACDISDIESVLIVIPANAEKQCVDTIALLEEKYPSLVKHFVQRNPYIGGALRDSVEETVSSHIMFFTADIPVGLESIPTMIKLSKRSPEKIIKISRWLEKDSFFGYNRVRLVFNFFAQKLLKVLFLSPLTDFTSPVLIAPTDIYRNIKFREWNFPCLLEAVLVPVRMKLEIEEFPAKCYPREEGKSKNSVWQTLLYLKTAFRIRFTPKKKLYKIH